MKFKLEIELGNEEMQDVFHISEALEGVICDLPETETLEPTRGSIMDINGNTVGHWEIVE